MNQCHVCEARTDAANLCTRCLRTLEKSIAELPALLHELDVTISRQDHGTGAPLYAVGRRRVQIPGVHYEEGTTTLPSTPWPFAWDAADLRWVVESTVVTWARHVYETRDLLPPRGANAGALLLDNLSAISLDEAAEQIYDELVNGCHRQLTRAIDRQAPDVFAGRCDALVIVLRDREQISPQADTCGADLYAHTGDNEVRCPSCGTIYDLLARKRAMLARLRDVIAPTTVIANGVTSLLEPVTPAMVRQMAFRGEIVPRGIDPSDGKSRMYRVGDVLDVLAQRRRRTLILAGSRNKR